MIRQPLCFSGLNINTHRNFSREERFVVEFNVDGKETDTFSLNIPEAYANRFGTGFWEVRSNTLKEVSQKIARGHLPNEVELKQCMRQILEEGFEDLARRIETGDFRCVLQCTPPFARKLCEELAQKYKEAVDDNIYSIWKPYSYSKPRLDLFPPAIHKLADKLHGSPR